jgi:excisionase family DNA binding protein
MSAPTCYTTAEICGLLKMPVGTFRNLKTQGKLPFLEELKPRLGKTVRYRADLVDRYLAGQWGQSRFFRRQA